MKFSGKTRRQENQRDQKKCKDRKKKKKNEINHFYAMTRSKRVQNEYFIMSAKCVKLIIFYMSLSVQ